MKLEQARAILAVHDAEEALARMSPALMAVIEKMRRAGYPATAGVIVGMATILDDAGIEQTGRLLEKDWR